MAHVGRPLEVQRATDSYWLAPGNLGKVLDAAPLRAPTVGTGERGEGDAANRPSTLREQRAAYMQRLMTALLVPASAAGASG